MRKLKLFLSLLMVMLLSVGNVWGAVVSGTTYNLKGNSLPTDWSGTNTWSATSATSYFLLTAAANYVQTDEFCQGGFTSIKVKARKYGGPASGQEVVTVSWVEKGGSAKALGTITPTTTTLTDYTISSPASVTGNKEGYIKITASSTAANGKGAGIQEVTINYTAGSCTAAEPHTVSFSTGDGNPAVSPITETSGGAGITLPAGPTPDCSADGWSFAGWAAAAVGDETTTAPTLLSGTYHPTENCTLFAVYKRTEAGGGSTTKSMTSFEAISGNVENDVNVSYAAAQGTASTAPAINNGEIRIYQNGGLLTITANNGSKLNSITIGSSMTTKVTYAVDGGSASGNNDIAKNGTFTVDELDATEVVFTCTGTDKNSRLYLNNLSVTYGGGGTTYYLSAPSCCEKHSITIANNIENGSVSADLSEACEGAVVTLTFEPSLNYHLSGWTLNGAAQDVNANTFSMLAGAATISATFDQDACEPLATPVVTVSGKAYPYDAVKLAWTAIDNADAYKVYIYDNEDNELEHNDAFAGVEYTIGQALSASTTYKYSVQAISNTPATYCPSEAATGSFVTEALPTAHLTLIALGDEQPASGDYSILTPFALPNTTASCAKTFMGWDANSECASAPTYAKGAEFTFQNTDPVTLYAVYADETPGEATLTKLGSNYAPTAGDKLVIVGVDGDDQYALYRETQSSSYVKNWAFDNNVATVAADAKKYIILEAATNGKFYLGDATNGYVYSSGSNNLSVDASNKTEWTIAWDNNASAFTFNQGRYLSCRSDLSGANQYLYRLAGGTPAGIYKLDVYKYATSASTYDNYSTTCVAAPTAEPASASIAVAAAGGEGTIGVSYENVNLAGVTVALFNNEACTEAFDGGWLTASIAGDDKHIAYTIAENTTYAARTAYIKLTAPETNGAASPAVVVIPVEQAKKPAVFASLEDLVAAGLASGTEVTVSFSNVMITEVYTTNAGYRYGLYLNVKDKDGENDIELFYNKQGDSEQVPDTWVKNGYVSATNLVTTWTEYKGQWELAMQGATWSWENGDITYGAPKAVTSVVVSGEPTKKAYVDGEKFNPAGLTVTVNYTIGEPDVIDAAGADWVYETSDVMALNQTSIKVKATYNTVTSEEWFTVSGLTVNDLETKTVAEFIAAEGGRCYLVGTVSNITNTQYGNFDLTDASGTIYVYGCLDTEGASKNFASLDVVEDDYIKVIADVYEYYNNTTHEAKNVQFVEELEKPEVPVASVSVANATVKVNKTVQLTATVLPENATNKSVTWSVKAGSEAIAEVNETTGVVTGLSEGEAVIIATSVADNTKFGECTVTVTGGINFAAGDFVLVEDAAELTEGTYVIVADAGTTYNVAMKYLEGTDKIHNPKAAVKDGKFLHYDSEFGVYQIKNYVVEEVLQGISFLNEDAENYLALPSASNELRVSETQDANSAWTVSISDGVATIANKALTARKIRYNSGSPRFACYESGQRNIALYKYVTPAAYRVYYNDNVAEEEIEVPAYQSVDGENKVTITAVEPVRDGYLFGGWKDGEANVYEAGVEYTLSADLTLYAQWTTATVSTLSYNPNGGTLIGGETAIADADVAEGTNLTIEANVYEKGDNFVFAGWQLGDDVYQPGDPFVMPATDVEFVAKWDAVEVSDYALVTDLAQLQAGDKIIIVAANLDFAAGAQAGTYRESVAIGKTASKNNLVLAGDAAPTEFTLGISDGKFSFNDGTGYMYEEEVKKVKTQAEPYYWSISIDAEGIATISAATDNALKYNSSSPRFTTYASGQQALQLYRKPGDAPTPDYGSYQRTVTAGNYGTICLPQAGTIEGATLYEIGSFENNMIYVDEVLNGEMVAGKPYIFQAIADQLNVTYTSGEQVAASSANGLHGFYDLNDEDAQFDIEENAGNYILYNNAYWLVSGRAAYIANFRAYIKIGEINAQAPAPGRRRVAMAVHGEQTATGVDAINATDAPVKMMINGQLFILRGEKMYDATGRLVK